ncbi:MAG: APC family permease, partial [Solirubrobacteraceae bacterium]|nr:APC family permease [Solirubrobacteraceae bacterium]
AEIYVGLLAATILFIATNAGIIGVSRLVYSMGVHRQLPNKLRELHPRFGTPWIGIILFSAVACVAITTGQADFLGNLYAFGAMLSFTIAHLAVIKLRFRYPDFPRPYRGPMNVLVGGVNIPIFAVLGAIGTGLAFIVVTVLHLDVAIAGFSWLAIGCVVYPLYRRSQGLSLTETVSVEIKAPVTAGEAAYESVLVALEPPSYSPASVATAIRLAARRRRGIHILVPIPVPSSAPIDAEMPEQEERAQAMIEQARLQGGRLVTGRWIKVRAGQAGGMIVQEAIDLRAKAIVLALPRRQGGNIFDKAIETVLRERPCRVIIQSDPASQKASLRDELDADEVPL